MSPLFLFGTLREITVERTVEGRLVTTSRVFHHPTEDDILRFVNDTKEGK